MFTFFAFQLKTTHLDVLRDLGTLCPSAFCWHLSFSKYVADSCMNMLLFIPKKPKLEVDRYVFSLLIFLVPPWWNVPSFTPCLMPFLLSFFPHLWEFPFISFAITSYFRHSYLTFILSAPHLLLTGGGCSRQMLKCLVWSGFTRRRATLDSPMNSLCVSLSSSHTDTLGNRQRADRGRWKITTRERCMYRK